MTLLHRETIMTNLASDQIFRELSSLVGWRNNAGAPVLPLSPESFEVRVHIRGNRFRITIRHAMRINAFAPVCEGLVRDTDQNGSEVRYLFRLSWSTRIFLIASFVLLAWMTLQSVRTELHASAILLGSAAQVMALVSVEFLLLAPLVGIGALLVMLGFHAEGLQEIELNLLRRALSQLATQ